MSTKIQQINRVLGDYKLLLTERQKKVEEAEEYFIECKNDVTAIEAIVESLKEILKLARNLEV